MIDLHDLKDVRRAEVWEADMPVARLNRTGRGVVFSYAADYAGPPVASTLPVHAPPVVTGGGALPPFFTGLLPEGRRLTAGRSKLNAR